MKATILKALMNEFKIMGSAITKEEIEILVKSNQDRVFVIIQIGEYLNSFALANGTWYPYQGGDSMTSIIVSALYEMEK